MLSDTSSSPRTPLRIKKDDKFYSRLLSKESSLTNASLRVYHGVTPGSVPFVWESQPGTPKAAVADATTFPPLTPPPSSHFNPMKYSKTTKRKKKSSRLSIIMTTLFLGLTPRKARPPPSPMSSSSSSSYFSQFGASISHPRSRFSSSRSSCSSGRDDQDHDDEPTTSVLCFRVRRIPII